MRFHRAIEILGLMTVLCTSGGVASTANKSALAAERQSAALSASSILNATDLQADVEVLRRAYKALHPGLYRYNTAAQLDLAFRALKLEFERDRTLADAYVAFSIFAAKVKCGHTYPNFFNQPKDIREALFRAGRVPFYFRWLGKRMIVTRSFASNSALGPGAEVLAINGVPTATIFDRLMTVARADGSNDAKRAAYIEVQGTERMEAFDVYFPLFFPSTAPRMRLRLRSGKWSGSSEVEVQPLTLEERLSSMKGAAIADGAEGPFFEFRLLEDGIGYLRMPTWALYNSKWNWKAFLTESFEALIRSGASDLVIDVRGNEGGIDVGDEIIAHLSTKEVPRQVVVRKVRYRRVPDDLRPYLDTWDRSFFDWGASAIDSTDGFFRLRRDADDDVGSAIKPVQPRFGGRTWVLVGASNSSATFEFAQTLRQNGLGKLVGQPTGGNQRGINGGAFFFLRLPHSRIELDLPLIGQFPDGQRPDAGLQPDIIVIPTVSDLASGRDAEMDAVRARSRVAAKIPRRR